MATALEIAALRGPSMQVARAGCGASSLLDGSLMVVGGRPLGEVFVDSRRCGRYEPRGIISGVLDSCEA